MAKRVKKEVTDSIVESPVVELQPITTEIVNEDAFVDAINIETHNGENIGPQITQSEFNKLLAQYKNKKKKVIGATKKKIDPALRKKKIKAAKVARKTLRNNAKR